MASKQPEDVNPAAMREIEGTFQQVLDNFPEDPKIRHFRFEYDKIFQTLRKSHDSEKKLAKQTRQLNQEIVSNEVKISTAMRMKVSDEAAISDLRAEAAVLLKKTEAGQERDRSTTLTLQGLRAELVTLQSALDKATEISGSHIKAIGSGSAVKQALLQEVHVLRKEYSAVAETATKLQGSIGVLEVERKNRVSEQSSLTAILEARKADADKESRRNEKLALQLTDCSKARVSKEEELSVALDDAVTRENSALKAAEEFREKDREYQSLAEHLKDLKGTIQAERTVQTSLIESKTELAIQQDAAADDIRTINQSTMRLASSREATLTEVERARRSINTVEQHQKDASARLTVARERIRVFMQDMDIIQARLDEDLRKFKEIVIARNNMDSLLSRSTAAEKKNFDDAKFYQAILARTKDENLNVRAQLEVVTKKVQALERARDKFGAELSSALLNLAGKNESLKTKHMEIIDLKAVEQDITGILQNLKKEFHVFRTERNNSSKSVADADASIVAMKKSFQDVSDEIRVLSAEMSDKESSIARELQETHRISIAFDDAKDKLSFIKRRQAITREVLGNRNAALDQIDKLLKDAESERLANLGYFTASASERDLLGALLVRKNDEIVLLHEKASTLMVTLKNAGDQFDEQAKVLSSMVGNASYAELEIATTSSNRKRMRQVRRELFLTQQQLIREQAKVKELSNEAEDPANLGRWREINIEHVDNKRILTKIQALQRRLIKKTEYSIELSLDIQERDKQITELQTAISKLPTADKSSAATSLRLSINRKTKKMKSVAAELNMSGALIVKYKESVQTMQKELMDAKKKYFEQRRREKLGELASAAKALNSIQE